MAVLVVGEDALVDAVPAPDILAPAIQQILPGHEDEGDPGTPRRMMRDTGVQSPWQQDWDA
jgi:hypothetical protein